MADDHLRDWAWLELSRDCTSVRKFHGMWTHRANSSGADRGLDRSHCDPTRPQHAVRAGATVHQALAGKGRRCGVTEPTLYTDIDDFACDPRGPRRGRFAPPGDVVRADISALVSGSACGRGSALYARAFVLRDRRLAAGPRGAGWPAEWSIVTGGFRAGTYRARQGGVDGARSGALSGDASCCSTHSPAWALR